jgi:hypothetical protein
MQELLNNDHLVIEILLNQNKNNVEKLRCIVKIMFRIEQLWSIENWQVKKSFVKIIYN